MLIYLDENDNIHFGENVFDTTNATLNGDSDLEPLKSLQWELGECSKMLKYNLQDQLEPTQEEIVLHRLVSALYITSINNINREMIIEAFNRYKKLLSIGIYIVRFQDNELCNNLTIKLLQFLLRKQKRIRSKAMEWSDVELIPEFLAHNGNFTNIQRYLEDFPSFNEIEKFYASAKLFDMPLEEQQQIFKMVEKLMKNIYENYPSELIEELFQEKEYMSDILLTFYKVKEKGLTIDYQASNILIPYHSAKRFLERSS